MQAIRASCDGGWRAPPPGTRDASLRQMARQPGAVYALAVLVLLNFVNYVDRYLPASTMTLYQKELKLTNAQAALPQSVFTIVYMSVAPFVGHLVDVTGAKRTWVLAGSVVIWSVCTASAALADSFWPFLLARALVGVGEGAMVTIAPDLISDLFAPQHRNRAMTIFTLATPVGVAAGYVVGGLIGEAAGWRAAFTVLGLPGLILSLVCLTIRDPGRGVYETEGIAPSAAARREALGNSEDGGAGGGNAPECGWCDPLGASVKPLGWLLRRPLVAEWRRCLRRLRKNRIYMFNLAGYTSMVFALGGVAVFFPTFLTRTRGVPLSVSVLIVGVGLLIGGLGGAAVGGIAASGLERKNSTRQPNFAVQGVATAIGSVLVLPSLLITDSIAWIAIFFVLAEFFLFAYQGPTMALCSNSVPADIRARAFAVFQLTSHLLGDALSPTVMGLLADATSLPTSMLLTVPFAFALAAVFWLVAWRTLPDPRADFDLSGFVGGADDPFQDSDDDLYYHGMDDHDDLIASIVGLDDDDEESDSVVDPQQPDSFES